MERDTSADKNPSHDKDLDKDTQKSRLRLYRLLTFIAGILIVVGVFFALGQISRAVYVLIFSLFITFIFYRPVDWLVSKRIPRSIAAVFCLLLLLAAVALVVVAVAPSIVSQVSSFVKSLPSTVTEINGMVTDIVDRMSSFTSFDTEQVYNFLDDLYVDVLSWVKSLASLSVTGIINVSVSIGNALIVGLFSFVAAFWFLHDFHKIGAEIHTIIGPRRDHVASHVAGICARSFGGYLLGQLVASVCTGVLAGIMFRIIGLPYSLAMGFLTGVMNFIPVIGPWIAGIVAALIGLPSGLFVCIGSVAATIIAQQVTDIFISPRVMSRTAQLHPALVIVAVVAGMSIGGILGMIFAVPITASAVGIFAFFFEKKTGRKLSDEHGALFRSGRRKPGKIKRRKKVESAEQGSDGGS